MSLNVLIVDDSKVMRSLIKRVLFLSGFEFGEIYEAGDGVSALKTLDEHWIDIVLTDIHMPIMDGINLLKKMKISEEFHRNLKTAISKVMETLFFLVPDEENTYDCSVYIGITGKPAYLLTIETCRKLAERMTEDLLGIDSEEVNDDLIHKCLQETANIIA